WLACPGRSACLANWLAALAVLVDPAVLVVLVDLVDPVGLAVLVDLVGLAADPVDPAGLAAGPTAGHAPAGRVDCREIGSGSHFEPVAVLTDSVVDQPV